MSFILNLFFKKINFFIFRYKFRVLALNNLLQSKRIGDYNLINLSGPYLSWFGFLIYKMNLSKNFKFISCDGWPYLNKEKNSINIWFGGTILKIPSEHINKKIIMLQLLIFLQKVRDCYNRILSKF